MQHSNDEIILTASGAPIPHRATDHPGRKEAIAMQIYGGWVTDSGYRGLRSLRCYRSLGWRFYQRAQGVADAIAGEADVVVERAWGAMFDELVGNAHDLDGRSASLP